MSSDYTPTEQTLRSVWWRERWDQKGQLRFEGSDAEFDRFINKVRADALRGAAGDLLNNPPSVDIFGKPLPGHIEAQRRLLATADRIEAGEA